MMLGVSGLIGGASGGSSDVGASTDVAGESGGGGGNRWPRQETLALLKIRSDMDAVFRDSSLKGALWEEVSRKMLELGFQRSAKKCKEKFENVFKYHKRTKDGPPSKSDAKTYLFFHQLEALENTPPPPRSQPLPVNTTNIPMPSSSTSHNTVSSTSPNPFTIIPPIQHSQPPSLQHNPPPRPIHQFQPDFDSTSSSSTSSDEDIQWRRGKKRKWKDFFNTLMKDIVCKQEELQKKFLETLEERERDRIAREETWRVQEMARMNREHKFLVQERSIAAAKDAAVIAFLQKVTDQNNLQIQIPILSNTTSPPIPVSPQSALPPQPSSPLPTRTPTPTLVETDNGRGDNSLAASSSRWPKAEVQALINLRTSLDLKYQENGPKGPLWEEISAAMAKLGYNRSSKRCKEKWENINKYFKKVKESSKKRAEDSKTCPYFHQLDAIYKDKAAFNHENTMTPIMARPEQQWPGPIPDQQNRNDNENESENYEVDEDEDDEEEDGGGGYEIVTNKQS